MSIFSQIDARILHRQSLVVVLTIGENVKRHIFRATGLFNTDPENLLHEALREPHNYLAILLAIASGHHRVTDIAAHVVLPQVDPYLLRLRELGLVRREVSVTVPKVKREASRSGRYVLADAYLRFYFRFIWPNQGLSEQKLYDVLWDLIREQLRTYIGQTAFEEICQEWVLAQARGKPLSFIPERVGSHWGKGVQVDAAINWRERKLLTGECKWGTHVVGRDVIRELIEKKTPLVQAALPDDGRGWKIHHVFFARAGFTEAAQAEAREAIVVDLARLDEGLS